MQDWTDPTNPGSSKGSCHFNVLYKYLLLVVVYQYLLFNYLQIICIIYQINQTITAQKAVSVYAPYVLHVFTF